MRDYMLPAVAQPPLRQQQRRGPHESSEVRSDSRFLRCASFLPRDELPVVDTENADSGWTFQSSEDMQWEMQRFAHFFIQFFREGDGEETPIRSSWECIRARLRLAAGFSVQREARHICLRLLQCG